MFNSVRLRVFDFELKMLFTATSPIWNKGMATTANGTRKSGANFTS